jgi:hypothetical protein
MNDQHSESATLLAHGGVRPARARPVLPEAAIPLAHGGVRPARAEPVSPEAIEGGDGGVTKFHDNGGRLLMNCRIVLIFWGAAWGNLATNPSQASFANALGEIVEGPWATQLAQYRGIGPIAIDQVVVVTGSDPPTSFTNPEIQALLAQLIAAGTIPAPANNSDRLYCVLMPTGHSSGDTSFVGQHQFFTHNGVRGYYAWISNDGTLTGGNSIPKVFCHEVAEACSDPDLGSGILVDVGSDTNEEIGDVCNNTWATVEGHAQEAYWSQADNRCIIPIARPYPAITGNPVLIQSRFGTKGNFELVTPAAGGGLFHIWRNNDNRFLPWSGPIAFGQTLGPVAAATMIESDFGTPGNLEVICRVGNTLQEFWRDSGPLFAWNGPAIIETGVSGNPVLIQSRFGRKGNFEMVVPSQKGGLVHYWRNNDAPNLPWSAPTPFGQSLGQVDAVTLIESDFGTPGNLEVICRVGDTLHFLWRDSGPAFAWNGPFTLMSGVAGNPMLIQSRFGTKGNFELVVPAATGGLLHFWRNNDGAGLPWSAPIPFGEGIGTVDAVTLIQSTYGSPGNLEVICRVGTDMRGFWRDSGPGFFWNGPYPLRSTTW